MRNNLHLSPSFSSLRLGFCKCVECREWLAVGVDRAVAQTHPEATGDTFHTPSERSQRRCGMNMEMTTVPEALSTWLCLCMLTISEETVVFQIKYQWLQTYSGCLRYMSNMFERINVGNVRWRQGACSDWVWVHLCPFPAGAEIFSTFQNTKHVVALILSINYFCWPCFVHTVLLHMGTPLRARGPKSPTVKLKMNNNNNNIGYKRLSLTCWFRLIWPHRVNLGGCQKWRRWPRDSFGGILGNVLVCLFPCSELDLLK